MLKHPKNHTRHPPQNTRASLGDRRQTTAELRRNAFTLRRRVSQKAGFAWLRELVLRGRYQAGGRCQLLLRSHGAIPSSGCAMTFTSNRSGFGPCSGTIAA